MSDGGPNTKGELATSSPTQNPTSLQSASAADFGFVREVRDEARLNVASNVSRR